MVGYIDKRIRVTLVEAERRKMCSAAVFLFGIIIILQLTQGNLGDVANKEYHYLFQKREIGNRFPYLAKLGYQTTYGLIWGCTGVVSSPSNTILTESFCISKKAYKGNLNIVQIGNRNYSVIETKKITEEIGAVILDKHVDSAQACILANTIIPLNTTAIVVGWSGSSPDNELHFTIDKELSETTVTVFEVSKHTLKVRAAHQECTADRGGPLQIPSKDPKCQYDVIGFLKEWKNCGDPSSFGTYVF